MTALRAIIARDVGLALKAGGGAAQAIIFFALIIVLFAFAVGPDPALLARIAAPVLWTTVLLAALLTLDRLFQADYEDGGLDILVQRTPTLALLVLAKAAAHWISTCLPLILATPVMAITLNLPLSAYAPLLISLLIGTPALAITGALGAALVFPLRRASVLLTLIIGPLFAPVMIFGVAAATPGSGAAPLLFLTAVSLMSVIVGPIAGAAAIRFNLA